MLYLVSVEFAVMKYDLCGTRNDSICCYLIAQDCDALVISEFRRNTADDQLIKMQKITGEHYFTIGAYNFSDYCSKKIFQVITCH